MNGNNPYYNPYQQYPYTAFNNMQYQQPQYQQPQPQPQPQPQTSYFPLTFVSGIEGAKAFIVQPGKKVYLLDSETNKILFIKSADNEGRYSMITKKLEDFDYNAPRNDFQAQPQQDYITRKEMANYATIDDLTKLSYKFDTIISELRKENTTNVPNESK